MTKTQHPPETTTGVAAATPTTTTEVKGIVCPRCGCQHLPVVYTRPRVGHILRVRSCRHCGRRMVTRERTG